MQEENLVTVKIKVYLVAVEADLSGGSTEIVIGVVALVAGAIKIIGELIVLIQYKVSKLEVSKLKVSRLEVSGVTVTGKIKESIRQQ